MKKRICKICGNKLSNYNRTMVCFHHEVDKKDGKDYDNYDCRNLIGSTMGDKFLHTHLIEEGYSIYK